MHVPCAAVHTRRPEGLPHAPFGAASSGRPVFGLAAFSVPANERAEEAGGQGATMSPARGAGAPCVTWTGRAWCFFSQPSAQFYMEGGAIGCYCGPKCAWLVWPARRTWRATLEARGGGGEARPPTATTHVTVVQQWLRQGGGEHKTWGGGGEAHMVHSMVTWGRGAAWLGGGPPVLACYGRQRARAPARKGGKVASVQGLQGRRCARAPVCKGAGVQGHQRARAPAARAPVRKGASAQGRQRARAPARKGASAQGRQ